MNVISLFQFPPVWASGPIQNPNAILTLLQISSSLLHSSAPFPLILYGDFNVSIRFSSNSGCKFHSQAFSASQKATNSTGSNCTFTFAPEFLPTSAAAMAMRLQEKCFEANFHSGVWRFLSDCCLICLRFSSFSGYAWLRTVNDWNPIVAFDFCYDCEGKVSMDLRATFGD